VISRLSTYLYEWEKEHPEDPEAAAQRTFIETKFGKSIEELAVLKPEREISSRPRFYSDGRG
jgi:hypothetical protein